MGITMLAKVTRKVEDLRADTVPNHAGLSTATRHRDHNVRILRSTNLTLVG